ncbi:DUF7305 domain-containing protein [Thermotoga caldifontis]|uniref:DUF7305 domain-containing protein n=1 Tax=Thermotoga caldifontis TaxID=1508419 RepID=UPI000596E036|nr:polymer-forming cytoskeletal protein [Thermotoga caldifontis]
MKSGSVLVVSLVVVVFLALTVLLMLAIYGQMTSNYVLQQKKFLVSNVARSGAYSLAKLCEDWFRNGKRDLVDNLANSGTFQLSLPEFRGTVECEIDRSAEEYTIKCKASLDGVEDSYTLTLILIQLASDLTLPYAIDANGKVLGKNNLTIDGDVLVRKGDLRIGQHGTIKGSVYLMGDPTGGNLILEQGGVIEGDVLAVGNVESPKNRVTIEGDVILAGSLDKNITVKGTVTATSVEAVRAEISRRVNTTEPPLPATPTFFPEPAVQLQGNVISISEGGKTYYNGRSVEDGLSVSNTTLTLKIPSTGLLSIAVTKLDLGNNTTIKIEGTGVVMIYVRDEVDVKNHLTIKMNKDTRLLIYSNTDEKINDGEEDISFKNGLTVSEGGLYIYTPKKDVSIKNTSNVIGAIVARNVNFNNNIKFVVPKPLPIESIEFDTTTTNTPYYGLYVRYGSWGQ